MSLRILALLLGAAAATKVQNFPPVRMQGKFQEAKGLADVLSNFDSIAEQQPAQEPVKTAVQKPLEKPVQLVIQPEQTKVAPETDATPTTNMTLKANVTLTPPETGTTLKAKIIVKTNTSLISPGLRVYSKLGDARGLADAISNFDSGKKKKVQEKTSVTVTTNVSLISPRVYNKLPAARALADAISNFDGDEKKKQQTNVKAATNVSLISPGLRFQHMAPNARGLADAISNFDADDKKQKQKKNTTSFVDVRFTVNDKISINGKEVASGAGISNILGCNTAPKDATVIEVCGCGVKVEASLLTECQAYGKYSHGVGSCDCSQSGCVQHELKSGYTEEFKWTAASYKVEAC